MMVEYKVTGKERKALVNAIAEILDTDAKYMGVPTYAYKIDTFIVDCLGALIINDDTDSDIVENLLEKLEAKGFNFEAKEIPEDSENELQIEAKTETHIEAQTEAQTEAQAEGVHRARPRRGGRDTAGGSGTDRGA